jgi:hypothetical protein
MIFIYSFDTHHCLSYYRLTFYLPLTYPRGGAICLHCADNDSFADKEFCPKDALVLATSYPYSPQCLLHTLI